MLTIAIDAGHPSREGDTGAVSACGRIIESEYTIRIARLLAHHLDCCDELEVHLVREDEDEVMDIPTRVVRADALEADLVLSIHVDAGPHKGYSGAHAIYWPGNSEGEQVARQIAGAFPPALRRSSKPSPAFETLWPRARNVLGAYPMTAVLVECGYATNPDDVDALVEDTVQSQIVGALAQGIRLFRQLREARWLKA